MNLVVRRAAAADLAEATLWYEMRKPGLGDEFLDAVAQAYETILEHPKRYRIVQRDIRRALVRRFPYSVFYSVVGDSVVVLACFHGSRDPRRWGQRRDG